MGNSTEATKCYDKALSISQDFDALNNKGNAISELAQSIDIIPTLFNYNINRENNHTDYGFSNTLYNNLHT